MPDPYWEPQAKQARENLARGTHLTFDRSGRTVPPQVKCCSCGEEFMTHGVWRQRCDDCIGERGPRTYQTNPERIAEGTRMLESREDRQ